MFKGPVRVSLCLTVVLGRSASEQGAWPVDLQVQRVPCPVGDIRSTSNFEVQNIHICFRNKNYGASLKKVFKESSDEDLDRKSCKANPQQILSRPKRGLQMLFGTWLMKSTLVNVITISRDPALSWQYHLLFLLYASQDRLQTRSAELIICRQVLFMRVQTVFS